MSNVIRFPEAASDHRQVHSTLVAEAHAHAVQFYESDEYLFDTVCKFLATGLEAGDRLVVIATEAHREGIVHHLERCGFDPWAKPGRLALLDARQTLARFMVGGMPDADLFEDTIRRVIASTEQDGRRPGSRIRAYGEMVDLLWKEGNSNAAIRLEELWDEAVKSHSLSLLCAYAMGNFFKYGDAERFLEVCRNHSHVLPTESFTQLDDPHARLREISFLQQRAKSLETEIVHRKELETALREALRDRSRVEEELRECVQREKDARARAEANDAFKEVFLGILGHDLRNPLNTVLTTARLMTMRRELSAESQKRLERVVSSGVRMQRMIEQLLDVTRARLADGIPVVVSDEEKDLLPLVAKIVDEIRTGNPTRAIELATEGTCMLRVDADRFEQVVSNLVGNAVAHSDPQTPVRVSLAETRGIVSLRVRNNGKPIAPAFLPRLFDPFKRGERQEGPSEGLGLGLYISERIVSGHGGKIEVSSDEAETSFEVILPRNRP